MNDEFEFVVQRNIQVANPRMAAALSVVPGMARIP